ncbi:MAG: helix-turn-helix domain-containing protein [Patescibacteria group bacterium]
MDSKRISDILKTLGFSEKAALVYLTLLRLGPSAVRVIAEASGLNRGTTYDILKELIAAGLVSYFHKEKRQHFVAEDPAKLLHVVESRKQALVTTGIAVSEMIPELKALLNNATDKPVTAYYEGAVAVKGVLKDVIATSAVSASKEYVVYSSATIRPHLYEMYPRYSDDRIAAGVKVRVIALGKGGDTRGLDERKWLTQDESAPTYKLIYPGKIALITVAPNSELRAVVVADSNLAATERLIFDELWVRL